MLNKKITITPQQNYTLLNFHPPDLIKEIQDWLGDEQGSALLLVGGEGSGRSYALEAACFGQQMRNKPVVVAPLDWSRIASGNAFEYLKEGIQDLPAGEREQEEWLELITETLGLELTIPAIIGASLTINAGGILKLARRLLPAFRLELMELDPKESYTALRRLLQDLSTDRHLVLLSGTPNCSPIPTPGGWMTSAEPCTSAPLPCREQKRNRAWSGWPSPPRGDCAAGESPSP